MFYFIVILTLTCISLVPPSCHTLVFIQLHRSDFLLSARSVKLASVSFSLSGCHALRPMRHLTRIPTVLVRLRPSCLDHPCLSSRPLSSFEAANAREHLHSPVTDHVPRFDWRLRVPTPKPPLSAIQKVPEKRAQPPLPIDSYPYNAHIQKYKDQSVMHRVPSLPIGYSPRPPVSSPFYHLSVQKTRLSLENASRTGA